MTDSSLWHRLNPFHPRPPSSLRRYSPVDSLERSSSVDTSVPTPLEGDGHLTSRTIFDHLMPESPSKQHHRTPSILRSLAHHPSLSALRSRSRKDKDKKQKSRAPIPPLPNLKLRDEYEKERERPSSSRTFRESLSPKKLRRKGSLKAVKSIPDDLRLSDETFYPRSSAEDQPPPPPPNVPTSTTTATSAFDDRVTKVRPKRAKPRRTDSSGSVDQGRPPPASTPDITVHQADLTPESVKVRRMRFQFDFSVDGSPPSIASLSAPNAMARRRAASTSEAGVSPSRVRSQNIRNRSSPAKPTPFLDRYASSSHPFTTQHPHPVPLTQYAQQAYRTLGETYDPEDFIPLTQSGRTIEDDGLDLLVKNEVLPSDTPGGKKVDLQRGALSDGAKHGKNAIRFFSRDMYSRSASSSHCSSPPSLIIDTASPIDSPNDRSESPFEVKLSPMVTKRMSLDAFGTPSPPTTSQASLRESGIEELAAGEEMQDEVSETSEISGPGEGEDSARHLHTSLSTIQEGSSAEAQTSIDIGKTPASIGGTLFFTPADSNSRDLPLPNTDSPFAPSPRRQHLSCPPLPVTQTLLDAHGDHARALDAELQTARNAIKSLEVQLEEMRERAEKAENEGVNEEAWQRKMKDLEELLQERDEEFDEINSQIELQAEEHGIAVSQLKTALEENEGYFDTLQQAHDELADRLAELETEHSEMLIERAGEAATLQQAHDDVRSLEAKLRKHDIDRAQAELAIVELQQQLHEAEQKAHRDQEDIVASTAAMDKDRAALEAKFVQMEHEAKAKDERMAELQDLLRAGLEGEAEIVRLKSVMKTKDERIVDLQTRQTERQKLLDSSKDLVAERDSTIATLKFRLETAETDVKRLEKESMAAVKSIAAKDMIIGVLRDKLSTTNYEKDELIAKSLLDTTKAEESRSRNHQLEEQVKALTELLEKGQEEASNLRHQLTETMGRAEANEGERRQAIEALEQLEAEKREWETERANLVLKLEQADIDAEEADAVHERLSQLEDELAATHHNLGNIGIELQDAHETLHARATTIELQDRELEYLRQALVEAEEAAESIGDGFLRRSKEAEREVSALREQLFDLSAEVARRNEAVSKAVMEAETEKSHANDSRSRLTAFASEIDRLSLNNAELRKQIDDIRRESSGSELKLIQLEKDVESLINDKELLNVALASKQTEVVLLQRQLGQGAPKPRQSLNLAASTSRVSRPISTDVTPVPTRMLSKSTSHSSLRPHSRASSVNATPMVTPTPSAAAVRARATATSTPLGASNRHNRTPEKRQGVKKVVVVQGSTTQSERLVKPCLSRRSSLPVLRGSSIEIGKARVPETMARVDE